MRDAVLFAKQTNRDTPNTTPGLYQPIEGDGLVPTYVNNLGEVIASAGWPSINDEVPVGVTASLALQPLANINTIRDLILMMTARTAGYLPTMTISHTQASVGNGMRFEGCVPGGLTLEFSRSGSPDRAAVLSASQTWECRKATAATISAGVLTQPTGRKFQIRHSTFTINGVGATKILSCRLTHTNEMEMGGPSASNERIFLEEGTENVAVELTAHFDSEAYRDLVLNETQHVASIIFATGTANETVTATMNRVQAQQRTLQNGPVTMIQGLTLKPFFDGTNPHVVWTFGSQIGASALSLP